MKKWQNVERNYSARRKDYFVCYGLRRLWLEDFLWYGEIIRIAGELVIGIHKNGKYYYAVNSEDCNGDFDEISEDTRVCVLHLRDLRRNYGNNSDSNSND